jgi:inosine/xanthosine triphosphate pyrophosphatase family protein
MNKLLLATNNRHKAGELRSLLANVPVEILTLEQYPSIDAIFEDQETLEGNEKGARRLSAGERSDAGGRLGSRSGLSE